MSGRAGPGLRTLRAGLLVSSSMVLASLASTPVRADCTPVAGTTNINCAPPGTGGFVAAGLDGQTLTVQPGTTVVSGGGETIRLRDGNTIINNGSVNGAGGTSNGIRARNNNTVINNGTINVNNGAAVWLDHQTALAATPNVINNGSIAASGFGAGLFLGDNHNILNNGTISVGAGGIAVSVTSNALINNFGTISAGASGSAVQITDAGNVLNNFGTIRAGGDNGALALDICDCATGTRATNFGTVDGNIIFDGNNNKLTNSGLITVTDPNVPIGFTGFGQPTFVFTPLGVAPGVGNTFEQTASGTLALRMDNVGNIDILSADIISRLAGTLRITIQPQLYQNQTFSGTGVTISGYGLFILGSNITTTFDRYVASSPFFTVTPGYDTSDPTNYTSIQFQLDRLGFGSVPGMTLNQMKVGTGLESQYSPNLDPASAAGQFFSNLLAATSVSALDNLSGEGTAALQNASFQAGSLFNNASLSQLVFGDGAGATSVIVPPAQYAGTPKPRGHEAFAAFKAPAKPPVAQTGRWRIWTVGFGGYRSIDGDAFPIGSANQTMRTYGGALGADYQLSPDLLVGFAAGGSESTVSVPDRATTGKVTAGHFGLYGLKTWGATYAAASASYARLDNSTVRTITGVGPTETASGEFSSDQLSARLELGWKRAFASFNLTPFVAIEPAVLWSRGYTETSTVAGGGPGILGLSFASRTTTSLPTFVGLQADGRMVLHNGMIVAPYGRLSWVHEFEPNRQINPTFVSVPGTAFTVDGARPSSDAARLDAGAKVALDATRMVFANFSGEWSGSSASYAATAGFRLTP